jgi:hypothetical protein
MMGVKKHNNKIIQPQKRLGGMIRKAKGTMNGAMYGPPQLQNIPKNLSTSSAIIRKYLTYTKTFFFST